MHPLRELIRQIQHRAGQHLLLMAILALGLGVNAAMFGVAENALFYRLGVPHSDTTVRIFTSNRLDPDLGVATYPWLRDLGHEVPALASVAAYADEAMLNLQFDGGVAEPVPSGLADGAFFDTLGLRAQRGRLLGPADDIGIAQHAVAVISDRFWRAHFDPEQAVVGSHFRLAGRDFQIVGVLPPGFLGLDLATPVDVWLPLAMAPAVIPQQGMIDENFRENLGLAWLDAIARLADGTSLPAAIQAVDGWAARRNATIVERSEHLYVELKPVEDVAPAPRSDENYTRNAWLLMAISALVLLVSLANAAGLAAARGREREQELAVRLTLGATHWALARQLFLESLGVAALALVLGLALAAVLLNAAALLAPSGLLLPATLADALSSWRLLVMLGVSTLIAIAVLALVPSFHLARNRESGVLQRGGSRGGRSDRSQRFHRLLVAGQVALSLVLLVGGALLGTSLLNTSRIAPGFAAQEVLAAAVDLGRPNQSEASFRRLLDGIRTRASSLPSVVDASWILEAPVSRRGMTVRVESGIPGTPVGADAGAVLNFVDPSAFQTLGVPLLRGRTFSEEELVGGAAQGNVLMVNQAYVDRFLPGVDPIGYSLRSLANEGEGPQIVGVTGNYQQRSLRDAPRPQIFLPIQQTSRLTLLLRSNADPALLAGRLQQTVAEFDPDVAVTRIRPLTMQLQAVESHTRAFSIMLIGFGVLSAIMSAAGLYGVLRQWVLARRREFGVRMAVGATPRRLARQVVVQATVVVGGGLLLGLPLAAFAVQGLGAMLFGVEALDPGSFLAGLLAVVLVAATAALVPIILAMRTDPINALRQE